MQKENFELCDRLSAYVLSSTLILVLLAFLPGGLLSVNTVKAYVLIVGVSLSFLLWMFGRFMEGHVAIPRTRLLISLGLLAGAFFLSALFSPIAYRSFFGESLDLLAFVPFLMMALGLFLASVLFVQKEWKQLFLKSAFISYIALAFYQLLHLFAPAATTLGTFASKTASPAGTWMDFTLLSGAALIGATLILTFERPSGRRKGVVIFGAALALFFLLLANILMVWVLVAAAMLAIVAYVLLVVRKPEEEKPLFPIVPFVLVIVALFLIITNSTLGYKLSSALNASYFTAAPNPAATVHTMLGSLKARPITGAGMNRFSHEWFAHRPLEVNANTLWNTEFSSGASLLFTEAALAGILGILALLFFLFAYGKEGIRAIVRRLPDGSFVSDVELFSVLLLSLYLMLAIVLLSPGFAVAALAFFFAGLLVATMRAKSLLTDYELALLPNRRRILFSVSTGLGLAILIALIFLGATRRVSAEENLSQAARSLEAGDSAAAQAYIVNAFEAVNLPSLQNARVILAEHVLHSLVSSAPSGKELSADEKRKAMEAVQAANAAAEKSIQLDPTNADSYILYGDLMKMLIPFKLPNAFENARDAYMKAAEIYPNYPRTYLLLANLYAGTGDNEKAQEYVGQAIAKKQNYTDAYILLSRMHAASGDLKAARQALENVLAYDTKDSAVYAEMGRIAYKQGDFEGAVAAFKQATAFGADDVNTWYYLALSLGKTGDRKNAAAILSTLHVRLPDDKNISQAFSEYSE